MAHDRKIAVIGLGYVGLPVAVAFGKQALTVGFDISLKRIAELKSGKDFNGEVTAADLQDANLLYTNQLEQLRGADFYIIAVPTPINEAKQPDLTALLNASKIVGEVLKVGDIVVFESTVYPGATEEECIPVLEEVSGLKSAIEFKVGYSPERINPGDQRHTFTKIMKVVSGQDEDSLNAIASVYESVVKAGIFKAQSIKVAEAAKVIENTQRDLNIALMNELALIFDRLGIDTKEVLDAAGSKWNFLPFKPGLVGGHCIGVDPYYLTYKAEKTGYIPQVILAGRRINDGMGKFIAQKTIKELIHSGFNILGCKVTILGLTFKENCGDLRNTKVIDVIHELQDFGVDVQIHDPIANPEEANREYAIKLQSLETLKPSAAVILAVAHQFYEENLDWIIPALLLKNAVLIDVKGITFPQNVMNGETKLWRL
jgi:UDP-N-acetyl-D-glucosamine/UDP-N-acetyl-D-galactosamine dehydrogenase